MLGRRDRDHENEEFQLDLSKTDLQGVDLSQTHLEKADLRNAHLEGAYLSGVNLEGVRGLTKMQIESAHIDEFTLLPDYLREEDETQE